MKGGNRKRSPAPAAPIVLRRRLSSKWLAVVALAALVAFDRAARGPARGDDFTRFHEKTARVVYVVDGDTLDVDIPDGRRPKTRIRLWGVDTPELGHGKGPDMHFASDAHDFARRMLEGKRVRLMLSPARTRDRHGRLLAYVFLQDDGPMFNEMLIEQGLGYADLRFDHLFDDRFERLDKQTRQQGQGLWANVSLDQMPAWKQRFERHRAANTE